jgi:hypothetical protein
MVAKGVQVFRIGETGGGVNGSVSKYLGHFDADTLRLVRTLPIQLSFGKDALRIFSRSARSASHRLHRSVGHITLSRRGSVHGIGLACGATQAGESSRKLLSHGSKLIPLSFRDACSTQSRQQLLSTGPVNGIPFRVTPPQNQGSAQEAATSCFPALDFVRTCPMECRLSLHGEAEPTRR